MRTKSKFRHGSSGGADTDDLVALGMCSALAAEAADDLGAARAEATCRQMWVAARKVEASLATRASYFCSSSTCSRRGREEAEA